MIGLPVSPVVITAGVLGGPRPILLTAITYISYSVYGDRFVTA